MKQQCICDCSSEEYSEEKREEDGKSVANRIFLNFSREFHHPAKARYNEEKVKELFKYLRERQDLQEMKVSGWPDGKEDESKKEKEKDEEEEEEEDEDSEYKLRDGEDESYYEDESSRRNGGQRFAMSRDFWYRKLNTLKAQKLDEAALEAEDLPPSDGKSVKPPKYRKKEKVYADEIPEKKEKLFSDLEIFEKTVAKPVEKELGKKFVNVYENRDHFHKD